MKNIILISYPNSPLNNIKIFLQANHITTYNNHISNLEIDPNTELWIDAYLDLYNPSLSDPSYLYHFFSKIHKLVEQYEKKCSTIRILQNFPHQITDPVLKKVFYLYGSFTTFFSKGFDTIPLFLPDFIDKEFYKFHPLLEMLENKKEFFWTSNSTIRIIHPRDIANHLTDLPSKEPCGIQGILTSLENIAYNIENIWKTSLIFQNCYHIEVYNGKKLPFIEGTDYELESILLSTI